MEAEHPQAASLLRLPHILTQCVHILYMCFCLTVCVSPWVLSGCIMVKLLLHKLLCPCGKCNCSKIVEPNGRGQCEKRLFVSKWNSASGFSGSWMNNIGRETGIIGRSLIFLFISSIIAFISYCPTPCTLSSS